VISLQVGTTGECQAAQTVSTGQWTVSAGTYLGAALPIVGYGTVFEIPQGVSCKVPAGASGNIYHGYLLPNKDPDNNCAGVCSLTDPRHRWIVFRTQQLTNADFPPFGSRITPDYAPIMGKFYSSQPNMFSQLFNADNITAAVHHYWFQNVEFEDDPAYSNPVDSVDPIGFSVFANLGSTYQTQNNQFMVLDRVYAHGPGAPIRHLQGYILGGNYFAMVGCYTSQIETWRLTTWPSLPGTTSDGGATLNIPQNLFRFSRSSPTLGMPGPATAMLSNITGTSPVIGNLYKDHLEIQYNTTVGKLTCNGCTVRSSASPSTPASAIQLFSGTISAGGQFTNIAWNTQEYQTSRYLMAFGVVNSDLHSNGGPYYIENNYLDGVGEGFYMDTQSSAFSSDDLTYTHNHHIWPKNYFVSDPANQWRYEVRQHWETKRLHRGLVKGNLFSYSWSYQNDGPAIFMSSRSPYITQPANDGISDIRVESNIVSHSRSGIECMGGNTLDNGGGGPEAAPGKRIVITNNLMFDLGRWKYCDTVSCPGLGSIYFANRPGCQDLVIENNTAGPTYGEVPTFLQLGGGQQLGNYLSFKNNVLYLSKGLTGYGGGTFGDWPANNVLNHDVNPAVTYINLGDDPTFKASLDASFVNTAATVTPNYVWGQNLLIGGWKDTNGTFAGIQDLSFSELKSYAVNMPAGDSYATGNTIAAREANANLVAPSLFNYRITLPSQFSPGDRGVDYTKLYADQGMVTDIQTPRRTGTTVQFQYTAPDSRGCVVDVGIAGSWTRNADSGGGLVRTVTVSNLLAGTVYQYRIICYYKQVNDGVLYTDYLPNQITDGSFRTQMPRQAMASIPFSLGSVPNAVEVKVTLTPVAGAPATQTCSTSPCTLLVDVGDYTMNLQYLSSSGTLLSSGHGQLTIQ
jgi:hypothetical protein